MFPVLTARPRARLLTGVGLLTAGALLVTTAGTGGAAAAPAARSQSSGTFLASALGATQLVGLKPALAVNTGQDSVTDTDPFEVDALNDAVAIPVGSALQLSVSQLVTQVGAAAQYAQARADGSALGASGAVSNTGAIAVNGSGGAPQDTTVDLDKIIGGLGGAGATTFAQLLGNATLTVGALSGRATQGSGTNPTQSGSYDIAGLTLSLTSPLLAQLGSGLTTLLTPLTEASSVESALSSLKLISVSGLPTLSDLLDTDLSVGPGISASLADGSITIDLAALLKSLGLDINALPPNTDLVKYLITALTTEVGPALQSLLTTTSDGLAAKFGNAKLTVTGTSIPLGGQAFTDAVAALIKPVTDLIAQGEGMLTDSSGNNIIAAPLAAALDQLLAITVNAQPFAAGQKSTFVETALEIGLLPHGLPSDSSLPGLPDLTSLFTQLAKAVKPAVTPAATANSGTAVASIALASASVTPGVQPAAVPTTTPPAPTTAAPTPTPTSLASTGSGDSPRVFLWGIAVLLAGIGLLGFGGRRLRRDH